MLPSLHTLLQLCLTDYSFNLHIIDWNGGEGTLKYNLIYLFFHILFVLLFCKYTAFNSDWFCLLFHFFKKNIYPSIVSHVFNMPWTHSWLWYFSCVGGLNPACLFVCIIILFSSMRVLISVYSFVKKTTKKEEEIFYLSCNSCLHGCNEIKYY